MPGMFVSCSKEDPGPEVPYDGTIIIIGAGAAGLYAADILHSKGIQVKILEASDQYGGRIRSLRNQKNIEAETSADFPIELGAEVVYGNDSVFGKIIEKYSLTKIHLATESTEQFILDNLAKSEAEWGGDADLTAVTNFVAGLPSYTGADVSMKQAAGVSTRADALLNSMAANYYGSSSDFVGAKGVGEALGLIEHDNDPYMIKTNPLQDILTSRFSQILDKVQLNTVVKSINYAGEKIIVIDKDGVEYEAGKVIVTTSLAVLKTGGVAFSPALPAAKVSSMNKIGMDHSIRIAIDFKRNFWGEGSGYIWGGTVGPMYLNTGVARSEFYRTLTITVHGPKAKELSDLGDGMLGAVLAELDAIYNNQATLYIRKTLLFDDLGNVIGEGDPIWFLADWGKDEFFKGGMSYLKVGASVTDREILAASLNDKVFFAGEATDVKGDAGTINGALNSAERVVEEIVQSILNP